MQSFGVERGDGGTVTLEKSVTFFACAAFNG
jgi:hypothetical protein